MKIGTNPTPSCLKQNSELFTQVILSMQNKHEQSLVHGVFCKAELPQPALYQRNPLHLMGLLIMQQNAFVSVSLQVRTNAAVKSQTDVVGNQAEACTGTF